MKKRVLSLLLCLVMALSLIPTTVLAATYINKVNITGVKTPVIGEKAEDFLNLTPADSTYKITRSYWRCDTEGNKLDPSDVFLAGKEYSLCVAVTPISTGYSLDNSTAFVFNGGAIEADNRFKGVNTSGELYCWTVHMTSVPKHIDTVNISGVKNPVCGKKAGDLLNLSTTNPNVVITDAYWYCDSTWNDLETEDVFQAGREYSLCVTVSPVKNGYKIDTNTTFLFNGGAIAASNNKGLNSDGNGVYCWTKKMTPTPAHVDIVDIIGIETPVVGRPVRDFMSFYPEDSVCRIYDAKWFCDTDGKFLDADYVFEEGKEYSLKVYVTTSDNNYCVDLYTDLRFNHGEIDTYDTSSFDTNCLEAWTETMLSLKQINTVNITGMQTPVVGQSTDTSGITITSTPADAFTVDYIYWWNSTDWTSEDTTFKAGKVYRLDLRLIPKDGYYFQFDSSGDYTGEATINGQPASARKSMMTNMLTLSSTQSTATTTNGPAAPSISISNNASTGKPKLTWKAVSGATQYEVYRATSKNGTYTKLATTTNLYLNNTSAVAGTTYYYKVRALNSKGAASGYSNIVYITCDCAKPVVKVSANSNGKPYLSWAKVDGATSYEIYFATSAGGEFTKLYTTSNLYLNHNSAAAGKTYYYKVLALSSKSSYATSAYSDVVSFKVAGNTAPAAPSISISNNASTGKPRLSWKAVSGAAQYEVYRATSKTGTYSKLTTTSNLYLNNTSAEAGTTYYYKVRALNANGTAGEYSNIVYITCDCAKPVVSVKLNSSNHPYISWAKVDGATSYEVYYATSAGGEFTKLYTTSNLYLNHNSAKAGTTYYYKVLALSSKSSYATSAYSDVVSIQAK